MNDCNRDVHEPCSRSFQAARAAANVDIDELMRRPESICTQQGQPMGSHPAPNSVSADWAQEPPSFGIRGNVRQLLRAYGDRRFEFSPTRPNLLLFDFGKPSTFLHRPAMRAVIGEVTFLGARPDTFSEKTPTLELCGRRTVHGPDIRQSDLRHGYKHWCVVFRRCRELFQSLRRTTVHSVFIHQRNEPAAASPNPFVSLLSAAVRNIRITMTFPGIHASRGNPAS
jgi:hypothetical protein